MGEISDMMLEGLLCCECGACRGPQPGTPEFETWQAPGVPKRCRDCNSEFYRERAKQQKEAKKKKAREG
jgi:hypothetical protein